MSQKHENAERVIHYLADLAETGQPILEADKHKVLKAGGVAGTIVVSSLAGGAGVSGAEPIAPSNFAAIPTSVAEVAPQVASTPVGQPVKLSHLVAPKETLSGITNNLNKQTGQTLDWETVATVNYRSLDKNQPRSAHRIKPGDVVTYPVAGEGQVIIEFGATGIKIAKEAGITLEHLGEHNPQYPDMNKIPAGGIMVVKDVGNKRSRGGAPSLLPQTPPASQAPGSAEVTPPSIVPEQPTAPTPAAPEAPAATSPTPEEPAPGASDEKAPPVPAEPTIEKAKETLSAEFQAALDQKPTFKDAVAKFDSNKGNRNTGPKIPVEDVARLAFMAGFRGEDLVIATALGCCAEGGGAPFAINTSSSTRRDFAADVGMMQIHFRESWGRGGVRDPEANLDPETNMKNALLLQQEHGWNIWYAFKNGKHKPSMDKAQAAVNTMLVGATPTAPEAPAGAATPGNPPAGETTPTVPETPSEPTPPEAAPEPPVVETPPTTAPEVPTDPEIGSKSEGGESEPHEDPKDDNEGEETPAPKEIVPGSGLPDAKGYVVMPEDPQRRWLFEGFAPPEQRRAKPETILLAYNFAIHAYEKFGVQIVFGDFNAKEGHKLHENGIDLDFDGRTNYGKGKFVFDNTKEEGYDQDITIELSKYLLNTNEIKYLYFNDPECIKEVNEHIRKNNLKGIVKYIPEHFNHGHIRTDGKAGPRI